MSVRRNVITGEPVLFAPERAARSGAFTGDTDSTERCPFCPGHEADTPPEIARVGDANRWTARVVPNKYPAAPGAEVIVESAAHGARFESIEDAEAVVRLYVERYRAHGDSAYVAVFKNEGVAAGSSIEHVHSQVVPVPFVPVRIARELEAFAKHCPLCESMERHRRDGLVIRETASFVWLAPWGSSLPYQQWLVPKAHVAEMTAFKADELAALLRDVARATSDVATAYNWAFINFPRSNGHAYVDVLPRMTGIAGFELGTGTFVEIVDPSAAANRLRTAAAERLRR